MAKKKAPNEKIQGALIGSAVTLAFVLLIGVASSAQSTGMHHGMDPDMMGMMHGSGGMDSMMKMMSDPRMQDHMEQCLKMMEGMTDEELTNHMKMCEAMMRMMS